jgi:hypothetical protein
MHRIGRPAQGRTWIGGGLDGGAAAGFDRSMSPLYVLALPDFAADDAAWIDAVRARHDPQAGLIGAHVTVVFAATGVAEAVLADHVAAVASARPPIAAVWRRVQPWTDPRGHSTPF